MTLTYSFDNRMGWYDEESDMRTTWHTDKKYIYDMYKASMIRAKKYGYGIRFYGDSLSIKELDGYYDSCICIDNIQFELLDDLKIWIHKNNDLDCVTFDGDIILTNKLKLPPNTDDVWFEYKETKKGGPLSKKFDMQNGYNTMLDIFKDADTEKYIPEFSYHNMVAWNVGFIKFNNQKTKDILLDGYYELKDFYLNKIDTSFEFRKKGMLPSLIVCQYHFGNLITYHKLKASALKSLNHKTYDHWVGEIKFMEGCRDVVKSILDGDNKFRII